MKERRMEGEKKEGMKDRREDKLAERWRREEGEMRDEGEGRGIDAGGKRREEGLDTGGRKGKVVDAGRRRGKRGRCGRKKREEE
jgi:hypothetical protein